MNIIRNKFFIYSIITISLLISGLLTVGMLLTSRVNAYIFNLTDKISQQIGHPVTIEKVNTKWDWFFLKISIKNLMVSDQDARIPLFVASEIVSTVDALDSIRTLSLKFKHLLLLNPRLVMQWNGVDAPSILGLGHKDVSGDINPAGVLKLLAMQRNITVENGDFHLQGKDGADLPFMGVRMDFNQLGNKEYRVTARGNIAAAVQPEFIIAVNYYGELQDYDASMVDFEIKTSNLQLAELFNFIPKYRQDLVHGDFQDFDLRGTIQNGTIRSIKTDFTITKIIVAKDTVVNGGTGHIEFVPGSNRCNLQLIHASIGNDNLFSQPINIDSISSEIKYDESPDGKVNITTEDTRVKFMQIEAFPEFSLQILANKLNSLNFNSNLSAAEVRKLLVLLPDKKLPVSLNKWFDDSLISGIVDNLKFNYQNKKFSWALGFKNTELKYSPDWPSVHDIDATLTMDDGKLKLNATKAMILDEEVGSLDVDFTAHKDMPYAVVNINGVINTTLAKGMEFLQRTPLKQSIGNELAIFQPVGAIGLDLKLKINVADTVDPIKVAVNMQLNNDTLQAPDLGISLDQITGNIKFTNNSVQSENLKLSVLGQAATAKISMDKRNGSAVKLSINTPMQISNLQKMLPKLDLSKFSGASRLSASVEIPWGESNSIKIVSISSDMVGVTANYPQPLNKSANTSMPLHLQYYAKPDKKDILKIKYAGIIDCILFVRDNKFNGGRIAINKKLEDFSETNNLHILGNIKYFDWESWRPLLSNDNSKQELPLELDVTVNRLKIDDTIYDSLKLKYYSNNKELFIDSPMLTGVMSANQAMDKISIKLSKLNIPDQKMQGNNKILDYLQEQRTKNKLPNVQFSCDKLSVKKHIFKNINLELLPHSYGYEIMNFSITNDNIKLSSRGRWHMDDKPYTIITGNAYTNNFGKVLAEWGYVDSMSRGKGELNFSVQWDGAPTSFDLLDLTGNSHIDLRSGSLTNVNPGLGRIIGLLSLETIQRRLQLDFSDLISRGFAFDKLVADVRLEPGKLASENILINSPAAKIEMFGKTGIKTKELDFTMYVTPKVGAGLPIAAAIAAGPAVGAAIWLFDKASGSKISELAKYKYSVTGTWDKPKIDEVSEINNRMAGVVR